MIFEPTNQHITARAQKSSHLFGHVIVVYDEPLACLRLLLTNGTYSTLLLNHQFVVSQRDSKFASIVMVATRPGCVALTRFLSAALALCGCCVPRGTARSTMRIKPARLCLVARKLRGRLRVVTTSASSLVYNLNSHGGSPYLRMRLIRPVRCLPHRAGRFARSVEPLSL